MMKRGFRGIARIIFVLFAAIVALMTLIAISIIVCACGTYSNGGARCITDFFWAFIQLFRLLFHASIPFIAGWCARAIFRW